MDDSTPNELAAETSLSELAAEPADAGLIARLLESEVAWTVIEACAFIALFIVLFWLARWCMAKAMPYHLNEELTTKDNTAIALSSSQSEKLREAAFEEFELRRRAEQIKKLERAARREAARRARAAEDEVAALPEEAKSEEAPASGPVEELPDVLDQGTIDRLKDLIQSWDKQLTGG